MSLYDGTAKQIEKIEFVTEGNYKVYNFTVEDFHTYYVSNRSVLVHNGGPCKIKFDKLSKGKSFQSHYTSKRKLLGGFTGKNYKNNSFSDEFLNDINELINSGSVEFVGKGTLKKDQPVMNIYRGNGLTVVTTPEGEWRTLLETGTGMDLGIQLIDE